jgi:WD40 repeat protein
MPLMAINGNETKITPSPVNPPQMTEPKADKKDGPKPLSPPIPLDPNRKIPTLDGLRRNAIPTANLEFAGGGDKAKVPPQVVSILGGVTNGQLSDADGHTASVFSLALSHDGVTLASGGADGTIRLWDLSGASAKPIGVPRRLLSELRTLDFSRDGRYLATGNTNGDVSVWDMQTGSTDPVFTWKTGFPVYTVKFSHNGKMIAVSGDDERARLFPLERGKEGRTLGDGRKPIMALVFSSDDRVLICGSRGRLSVSDTTTSADILPTEISNNKISYFGLSQSPDGTLLASNGQGIRERRKEGLADIFQGAGGANDKAAQGAFSVRDLNKNLLSVSVLPHEDRVWKSGFSADGKRLATVTYTNQVQLWDWQAQTRIGQPVVVVSPYINKNKERIDGLRDMILAPDGRHAILAAENGLIYIIRFD